MKTKLTATVLALVTSMAFVDTASAQVAGGRPANATPPTVAEITARLQARGLTDAQIAERIAAIQAAVAAGQRPQH
ncbi:MAG: hypothetical protein FJX59_06645, partial [Alphaproteobacteria bacterium]|nr:hypothetical protein [Alphaproteobacteria bacterium]